MIPVLSNLLCDNESLFEYERYWGTGRTIPAEEICRRLVAVERQKDFFKNDSFYDGLRKVHFEKHQELSELLWNIPWQLAQDSLIYKNGQLYVKDGKFDEWMELLRQFPPLLMIAAFFESKFTSSLLNNKSQLTDFINTYLKPFRFTALLLPYLPALNRLMEEKDGLNDLHVHLNGTTETDVLWNYLLMNPDEVADDFLRSYNKNSSVRKLTEQVIADFTPDRLRKQLRMGAELRSMLLVQVAVSNGIIKDDNVIRGVKKFVSPLKVRNLLGDFSSESRMGIMVEELLFYLLVLSELRNNPDDRTASRFHHYLLIKGLIHRMVVMQQGQTGFPQFQLLTNIPFRWRVEEYYQKRFLQLQGCNKDCQMDILEGRFAPKASSLENYRLINRILKGYQLSKVRFQLSLVAHFIKRPESKDDCVLGIRHRFLRKELKKKAMALSICIEKSSRCASVVRGIDAAASEFDAGPEVFAPIYHYMRKKGILHFTYHVGEDFKHLLSGLRAIAEAVDFLDLHPGDRLGHCTGIGISPDLWMKRVGSFCYLSQGEWLDNLVFVWDIIKETQHEQLQTIILKIESDIRELSCKIYEKEYSPFLLSTAWKLRKYDPFLFIEKIYNWDDDWCTIESYEEYKKIEKSFSEPLIKELFSAYHAESGTELVDYRENYNRIICVPTNYLTTDQLTYLQMLVLDKLSERKIVIEALPSSNLCISYYRYLQEYHLKKWLDDNDTACRLPAVVLGSDDPGIFMTNVYNEYARAYLHLERCGCSEKQKMEKMKFLYNCSTIFRFK